MMYVWRLEREGDIINLRQIYNMGYMILKWNCIWKNSRIEGLQGWEDVIGLIFGCKSGKLKEREKCNDIERDRFNFLSNMLMD